jgi:protein-disulfide isomerase/uncharacterized membrane protein
MVLLAVLTLLLGATALLAARDALRGALAASAIGLACSGYLLWRKVDGSGEALCNINQVLNCDVVNSSPASEWMGVPISLMGVGWFLGLLLAGLLLQKPEQRFFHVLALGSGVLSPWCVWLGIEAARLGAVCVLCLSIYACVAIGLVTGLRGMRAPAQSLLDLGPAAGSAAGLTVAATWLVAVVGGRGLLPSGGARVIEADADLSVVLQGRVFQPDGPVRLDGDEPRLGRADAPYELVEFADFACPHCAVASTQVKALAQAHPNLTVAFRTYPLSGQCNAMVEDTGPERCHAAAAAECAHVQGRFWDYSALLFENQTRLADDDLRFMAEQVGLDVAAWTSCVQDPIALARVVADAMAGNAAGVMGTPTFFLRGPWGADFVRVERVDLVPALIEAHAAGRPVPEPVAAPR